MEDQNGSQHFDPGDLVEETIIIKIRCIALRVLQTSKGFGIFFSVNHLSMQITMQCTRPAWPVNTKLT